MGSDQRKTKAQLIAELTALRARVVELEGGGAVTGAGPDAPPADTLLAAVGQAVMATDTEGRITYWSPGAEALYGWTAAEVLGRPILEVTPSEASAEQAAEIMAALQRGERWTGEFPVRDRHGRTFPALVTDTPVHDTDGTLVGIIGVSADLSELRQEMRRAARAGAQAQRYLDLAGSMFIRVDADETVGLANRAACAILGGAEDDILGRNWFDTFIPERHRAEVRAVFHQLLAGDIEPVEYFDNPVLTLQGEARIIAWHNTVLRGADGAVTAILGSGDVVTEHRAAEQRLQESEARLRGLYESVQAGVVLQRADGEIVHANRLAAEILSMPTGEIEGKTSEDSGWEMITEEGTPVPGPEHPAMITLRTGEPIRGAVRGLYAGDPERTRWLLITTEPHLDDEGRVAEVLTTFIDITDRKRSEAEVQEARDRAQEYLDLAGTMFIKLDPDGRVALANRKAREILGGTQEEIVGRDWFATFIPAGERAGVRDVFDRLARGEDADLEFVEMEAQTLRGERRVISWHNTVLRDADGGFAGTLSSGEDVTDRHAAEQDLRESEARYRQLTAHAGLGIGYYDLDGRLLLFNEVAAAHMGGRPEDFQGQSLVEMYGEAYGRVLHDRLRGAATAPQEYEDRVPLPTGDKWFMSTYTAIRDDEERVTGVQIISQEITELKLTQEQLRESEEELRQTLEATTDGIWKWDFRTAEASNSDRYYTMLGYTPGEFPASMESWLERVHPDDRVAARAEVERFQVSDAEQYDMEFRMRTRGGEYRWIRSRARLVRDGEGAPQKLIGSHEDVTPRKQAETRLRESEERLDLALRGAKIGMWDWNVQTGKIHYNDLWVTMLGYAPGELGIDYQVWDRLLHPDDREATLAALERHLADPAQTYDVEFRLRRKNGGWAWIRAAGQVFAHDAAGRPLRMLGTHVDISAQKQAEARLRESEELLLRTGEMARVGGWRINLDDQTVYWSAVTRQIHEVPDDYVPTLDEAIAFFPGESGETIQRVVDRAIGHGEPFDVEVEFRALTGTRRWTRAIGQVETRDGEVVRVWGTFQDLTARKRQEDAYRTLVESSLQGLAIIQDLDVVYINPYALELTGYSLDELQAMDTAELLSLIHADDREQIWSQFAETLPPPGAPWELEYRYVRKDGEVRWMEALLQVIEYQGRPAAQFVFHDVTDRKQAEAERARLADQLQHAQKLESLGVLAGGIAHDFANILLAILGNAALALEDLPAGAPVRQNLEQIEQSSRHASDLCKQMLAYSGKGRFQVRRVTLNALVEDLGRMLEVSVSKKAVLRPDLAPDLPAIEADTAQLTQVVMNLITNASDAIGDRSGVIALRTGVQDCDREYLAGTYLDDELPPGRYVFLEVSDTGGGMDAETRARIFDPFFTTKFQGRGLGLAAVLGIVRGHRGAIQVYSEPDGGTSFKVLFPVADSVKEAEAAPAEAAAAAGPEQTRGTVLLADDEPAVRMTAEQILARVGYEVLLAADGREALELHESCAEEIVCAVLDLTMPHLDGEETFRALRRRDPELPVLLSSGYADETVLSRFRGKRLSGFIQKPYQPRELRALVAEVVARREADEPT